MRHISIKVRMTIWFTVVMVVISSLMLVFVMLMNRNQVTKPPAAQVVSVVTRNADRLERSFEAERQFTSDASHELRTPVAVILAECDSLDHGQPTEEDYRQSVDVIRRQGQQMSRLIGQLLHITRLEQGTQKLQLETADLSQLVEVLCEEQAHLAPEGTTLAVHTQPDLLVNGDVTLLSRLLAEQMELDDQKKIISYTYGGDKSRIAALAPLVEQAAGQGDAVALEIIRDNAVKMTGLVGAVARQLGIKAGKVAMLGGLLEHETKLRETFVAEMGARYPTLICTEPEQDAAAGALMLAKEML